jgi:integrase
MKMEKTSRGINKADEVEPIKNVKDIQLIKTQLKGKDNKRDYLLFTMGINVGLRAGDLLSLKINDVLENGKVKENVTILEGKTDKKRTFEINKSAKEAIELYISTLKNYSIDDYLFSSRKGNDSLTVESAHKIIKTLMRDLKIKGNFGTHTLRKTFAYHAYNNGTPVEVLQKLLNHSSSAVTLRYIGITKEVIANVYDNVNL